MCTNIDPLLVNGTQTFSYFCVIVLETFTCIGGTHELQPRGMSDLIEQTVYNII